MDLKVEVEILESLVNKCAENIGPMTKEYLRIVSENIFTIDYDWYIFAKIFYVYTDIQLLEKACRRALDLEILDVQKFEIMLSMMNCSIIEDL